MVYGIMNRLGGEIEVKSAEGKGTVVRLSLPAYRGTPKPELPTAASAEPKHRLRVLVVDDEASIRATTVAILRDHDVVVAKDGCEGLEKFLRGRFDLVIMDRSMPLMNGEQLAVAVKELVPDMPIILLTGFGDMMQDAGERPFGVDMILNKPTGAADLRKAVMEVMAMASR
jgi:CheY-like chemotaxis protein